MRIKGLSVLGIALAIWLVVKLMSQGSDRHSLGLNIGGSHIRSMLQYLSPCPHSLWASDTLSPAAAPAPTPTPGRPASKPVFRPMSLLPTPSPAPGPASESAFRPIFMSPHPAPSPAPTPSPLSPSDLQVGFYKGKCTNHSVDVEALIEAKVRLEFSKNSSLLPALLRLQFHDCFVNGCDASILIDGVSTEKNAIPNLSVRGYELIDAVKVIIEQQCPDVVSCADIIAVATKVVIKLGGGPDYPVQTGRRDGLVSNATDVKLPNPFMTVPDSTAAFAAKNISAEDMVVLLGCHSVGIAHCRFVEDRLYNTTGLFDPLMDSNLRRDMMQICPQNILPSNITNLNQDPNHKNTVDNTFYGQLIQNRGILAIDQELSRHNSTHGFVQQLAQNSTSFKIKLAEAMVRLQAVEVLTGSEGEIRKVCSKFN